MLSNTAESHLSFPLRKFDSLQRNGAVVCGCHHFYVPDVKEWLQLQRYSLSYFFPSLAAKGLQRRCLLGAGHLLSRVDDKTPQSFVIFLPDIERECFDDAP